MNKEYVKIVADCILESAWVKRTNFDLILTHEEVSEEVIKKLKEISEKTGESEPMLENNDIMSIINDGLVNIIAQKIVEGSIDEGLARRTVDEKGEFGFEINDDI